ncbi:MAG TPA: exosortase A, partial [Burkholderiaceae bacterium]|nr:exosortase A [Burkholderiaceae bacterium]
MLAGGLAALALTLLFFDTARSMVAVWSRSATFNHGFLVVPIALWLAWRRRDELAGVPVRPFWPALFLVAGAGFAWLLGRLAAAAVVEHFALVLMIQAALLTVYGVRFARVLALPLLFLFFAVPFGEAFVPKLIDWTADFTVFALKASGIPVYREGNYFMIPSGQWSVVEACSGIRYLIASLMVGVLFAHLMYASRRRQILFVVASVLVPIVANWLRAYFIVLIGHLSGNELAVGVDHLIYGWVFFGIVMLLLFWAGAQFRDAPRSAPAGDGIDRPVPSTERSATLAAAAAAIVVAAFWIPVAAALGPEQDTQARR